MSSTRTLAPADQANRPVVTRDGTLCQSPSPAVGITDANYQTWRAARQGTPVIAPSVYQVIGEFQRRINAACSVEDLSQLAAEVAELRGDYERRGLVRAPKGGDEDVKNAVKEVLSDQLSALQKIIFAAGWALTDEGVAAAVRDGAAKALWEASKEIIEGHLGHFAREAAAAVESRQVKDLSKAAAAAAAALAESFSDRDGMLREVLRIMRRNGLVIDRDAERRLRKWLTDCLAQCSTVAGAIARILASPVIVFVKVFFTPSAVPDDAGELYLTFRDLQSHFDQRLRELLPVAPLIPARLESVPARPAFRQP